MTEIQKILYPTDFSVAGQAALEYATSLARDNNAEILIVHAMATIEPVAPLGVVPISVEPVPDAQEKLDKIVPFDSKVRFQRRLIYGKPDQLIVQCAEDENVDLIVMGTHGSSGLTRLLMGSVAEAVVRRSVCPVLTIKQPSKELQESNQ